MMMLYKNADKRLKLYKQKANGCRTVHAAKLMPPLLQTICLQLILSKCIQVRSVSLAPSSCKMNE